MLATRTPADELAEHWSTLARAMLSRRHSASVYGRTGPELSPGRRQAVLILDRSDLRMGELARRLGLEVSTVTRLVDRLERGGLAERRAGESDRRSVTVALTAEGRAAAERMRARRAAFMAEVLEVLDPTEQRQLVALMGKVGAALGERA
jgi:MarR family transcriptional regulator, temperature-dependent positive regulator of motility